MVNNRLLDWLPVILTGVVVFLASLVMGVGFFKGIFITSILVAPFIVVHHILFTNNKDGDE